MKIVYWARGCESVRFPQENYYCRGPLAFLRILCSLSARQVQRRVWRWVEAGKSHGLSVTKDSHWEVLNMSWPLGSELEKLHIIPLHSINSDYGWKRVQVKNGNGWSAQCFRMWTDSSFGESSVHLTDTKHCGGVSRCHHQMAVQHQLCGRIALPLSIVCWCLAVQINLLMPSITWLLESSSFSLGFLLRKITVNGGRQWAE